MILWSFTAYDSQTRSLLEHDQKTAELDSHSKSRLTASDQKEIQEANKKLAAVRD